ncbi:hypothetical protein F53441_8415 [Fusarium austroafricanum]|uniref:Uncharacterized protein n=1 Tax=Fusarium austroafricanum TaxID=2364996 RepID=A0A8H4KE46_9HYPO|nr:hypothetical protein F53441_8415 [Fusarium austroafricanum]
MFHHIKHLHLPRARQPHAVLTPLSISPSCVSLVRAIGAFVLTYRKIRDVERISPGLHSCRTVFKRIQEDAPDEATTRSSAKSRVASQSPRISWTMKGHDDMEMMHFSMSMNWRCDSPPTCSIYPPRAHPAANPTIQTASQFLRMVQNGDSEAPTKKSNADFKAMFLASGKSEDKKTEDGEKKKESES